MVASLSIPDYDASRGKRARWKSSTSSTSSTESALSSPFRPPLRLRLLLPLPVVLLLLLVFVPLLRFLLTRDCESPFTNPDDETPLPRRMSFPLEPLRPQCSDQQSVLIVVVSRPSEFQLRRKIRSSWAHPDVFEPRSTKVVFLVGRGSSEDEEDLLMEENRRFDDVVMVNVRESYYNLSIKTLALLQYKLLRCPSARCLVKADSDNVLNIRNYESLCENTPERSIVGECGVSRRVIRSGSKWAVPFDVYPLARYPQYCSTGTYFLIGRRTVHNLVRIAHASNFFSSANMRKLPEDVLFTGILAEMADIERRSIKGLSFFGRPVYDCVNGTFRAYSLHMDRLKDPSRYFGTLNLYEGRNC